MGAATSSLSQEILQERQVLQYVTLGDFDGAVKALPYLCGGLTVSVAQGAPPYAYAPVFHTQRLRAPRSFPFHCVHISRTNFWLALIGYLLQVGFLLASAPEQTTRYFRNALCTIRCETASHRVLRPFMRCCNLMNYPLCVLQSGCCDNIKQCIKIVTHAGCQGEYLLAV